MRDSPFEIAPLGKQSRSDFSCGSEALDRYFKTQVTQDIRRLVTACFVALERESGKIAGFYTLSAADIPLSDLPVEMVRRLPRYPSVPTARIGRLAVDQHFQGRKLGGALVLNAAMRAVRSEVAVFALVVDAKDEKASAFYRYHGFSAFGSSPKQLIAPIYTFSQLL